MDLLLGSTEEEDCGSPHNSPNNHPTDHSLANQVNSNVTSQPEGDECLDSYAVADSSPIKAESSNVGGGLFENLSSFVVSNTFASSSNQMTSNGKANLSDSNHQPLPQTHRNSVAQHSVTTATTTTSYLSSHFQSLTALTRSDTSQVVNAVRTQDIALLDYLRVRQIVDLMVEKKKVKFGLNITSSEKADKLHRYREFDIICLPYPGCEFFKQYRNNQYQAEGLVFDWQQPFVDAVLEIPAKRCGPAHLLPIDFSAYKQWDVIKLTQNYLRLIMLNLITDNQQSMLIHCISGWDRTPLFISLLRLSLWADRRVHTTLTAEQITYLTLAYDWYLFGHNLADRVNKGEEILFFCFYFLKFIAPADYSVDHFIRESHKVNSTDQARKCCECCKPNTPIIPTTNATSNTSYSTTKSNLCASPEQIHHPNMTKIQSPMKSVAQAKVSLTTQTSSTLDDSKKKCQRKRLDVEKQKNEENAPAGDVTHSDVLDLSITDELSKMSVEAQSTAKTSSISPTSSPSSSTSSSSSTASQSPSFNCKLDQSNITTTIGSTSITTKNRSASITIDMPSIDSCASLSSCTAATIVTTTSNATTIGTPTDLNDLQLYDIISLDEQSLSSNSSIEACLPSSRFQKSLGRSSLRDSTRRSMIGHQAMMTTTTGTVVSHPSSTCKFMLDDEDDDTTPIGCLRRDECDLDDGLLLAAAEEADSDLNRNSSDTNLIRRSNAMAIPISNRRPANSVSFGTNDGQSARLALNQSNSSLPRSDSWQLVTETGSIRDKGFYSSPESFKSNGSAILFGALSSNTASNSGNLNNARSHGSFTRSGNNKTVSSPYAISSNNSANKCPNRLPSLCCCCEATCARLCTKVIEQQRRDGATNPSVDREQRLEQVRSLFYSCYSSVIGYPRHRNGPDLGTSRTFQALFSQLDTIGINPFGRISTPNL